MSGPLNVELDLALCRKGIDAKIGVSRRTLPQLLTQATANIIKRTLERMPPPNVDTKRQEIRAYLATRISTRVKLAKSGKRKGQFIQKAGRNKQLQRAHLILQARRRKAGLPGLYGKQMLEQSGKFKQRSTVSVGYAKSLYIPAVRALNPVVRYKVPYDLTRKIARWPGSAGYGQITLPQPSDLPQVVLQIGSQQVSAQNDARLMEIEKQALQLSADEEGREAIRWAAEQMQERMNQES
jgi:hypothetical protein